MKSLPFKDIFNNRSPKINTQVAIVVLTFFIIFYLLVLIQPYILGQLIERHNNKFAQLTIDHSVEFIDEVYHTLSELASSSYELCSDEEMAHLKSAYMSSDNVKDYGRRYGGNFLYCSAYLGHLEKPLTTRDNDKFVRTYNNLTVRLPSKLVISSDLPAIVLIRGDYNAVIDNSRLTRNVPTGINFKVGIYEVSSKQYYLLVDSQLIAKNIVADIQTIDFDWNYCSKKYGLCMHVELEDELRDKLTQNFNLIMIMSALLAAFTLSFGLLYFYRRYKSLGLRFKRALKNHEINVVYQPIICYRTKRFISAEALIRWPHETTSVDLLIELAEKQRFIHLVTDYVICAIKNDLTDFLSEHPNFRVTINVSAQEFIDNSLFASIYKYWPRHLYKNQLGIELTERSSAQLEVVGVAIDTLCTMGHIIYIDDFGTGYSSLSQVSNLHVDFIKLDKSFIQHVRNNPDKASLIPDILSIVNRLNLGLVLEGIEYEDDLKYFDANICEYNIQGWLFALPMNADQLIKFIDEKSK